MGALVSENPNFQQHRTLSLASVPEHMVVDMIYSSGMQWQQCNLT